MKIGERKSCSECVPDTMVLYDRSTTDPGSQFGRIYSHISSSTAPTVVGVVPYPTMAMSSRCSPRRTQDAESKKNL